MCVNIVHVYAMATLFMRRVLAFVETCWGVPKVSAMETRWSLLWYVDVPRVCVGEGSAWSG